MNIEQEFQEAQERINANIERRAAEASKELNDMYQEIKTKLKMK